MSAVKKKSKKRRVATRKNPTNFGGFESRERACADSTEKPSKARECQRPKQGLRKIATKQAIKPGVSPISGVAPPKSRQFGEPDGNPRHSGAWKKEDTLRYKLEKIMNGLDEAELEEILSDPKTSPGVRKLATLLYKSNYEKPEAEWRVWEGAMNQAYGLPKQSIEQTNLEPPVPLSPRSAPTEPGLRAEGAAVGKERASATRARSDRSEASATPRQTGARNTSAKNAKSATARTLGGGERK